MTKSVQNVIRNLNRSKKNSSEYSRVHTISSTDNNSNWKRLSSILRWGVCRHNLFEFSNILKIKPRIEKFSLDGLNDLKLATNRNVDKINFIGKFGKNLNL